MRRYEILITDQDGKPKVVAGTNGATLFNGTFTSTPKTVGLLQGSTIPGALNIELDVPVSVYNSPLGGASLRVYGVGLPLLAQAADFNPSIDGTKYCNIQISCGMAKGLPLAKPSQYGIILKSRIQQAFGNWQGTSQTLDFIMIQPTGSFENPFNFTFKCPNNGFLGDAIKTTLNKVFPNATAVNINISDRLKAPEEISTVYYSLDEFSAAMNERSRSIVGDKKYPGIQITFINNVLNVYDWTKPPAEKPIDIAFEDLIGQPTWISPYTMTFKTTMRYDIKVGSQITMPQKSAQKGLILTAPSSQSQYKETVDFQGTFNVQTVRHIGMYRQADANSWVTVYQVYKPPV
jgi:hypothetical protein